MTYSKYSKPITCNLYTSKNKYVTAGSVLKCWLPDFSVKNVRFTCRGKTKKTGLLCLRDQETEQILLYYHLQSIKL